MSPPCSTAVMVTFENFPQHPQPASTSSLALAVWQDQVQLPREMPTAKHYFGLILTREFERELSPGELSSASALDEFLESADSTVPVPPGWDKRTPCDAALTSIRKGKDFLACSDDCKTNRVHSIWRRALVKLMTLHPSLFQRRSEEHTKATCFSPFGGLMMASVLPSVRNPSERKCQHRENLTEFLKLTT